MERGVRNGYPVVDLRVTLTDGKAHSVDSSDMAFQSAGALALREAAAAGGVCMLEPYDEVAVLVLDDQIGGVMSDLSARRGRLLGTDKVGEDRTQVRAVVPQSRAGALRDRPARVDPRRRHLHADLRALRADGGEPRAGGRPARVVSPG